MNEYSILLKNKNFIALWFGQVISEFGDRLAQMALIASVYYGVENGRIFRLTTLLSFTIIPVFIIGPIAGAYADKWNRKRTMIICDILRGLMVLLIPFFLLEVKSILPISILVFMIFSVTRFFLPAKLGIIPDIVSKDNLLMANSLITTTGLIAAVVGLGLGGLIIELVGVKMGFYIDSISFFISAIAILMIKVPKKETKPHESILAHSQRIKEIEKNIFNNIKNSIRYIFTEKQIPFIMKTFFWLMSGIGAIYVLFIDFILRNLTEPPEALKQIEKIIGFGQFGFIIVFLGSGALFGTILFGRLGQKLSRSKAIFCGFTMTGFFLTMFSYGTQYLKNFWVTSFLALLMGLSAAPIMAVANTLLQEVTQDEMRGKVFSTLEIVIHLAFLIFMYLAMFMVGTLKIHPVHILGFTGMLGFFYGIRGWLKEKSI
jgi:MFS family permease